MKRASFRTRLALVIGALFLLAGALLLMTNYVLLNEVIPDPDNFVSATVAIEQVPDGRISVAEAYPADTLPPADAVDFAGGVVTDYRASVIQTILLVSGIALAILGVLAAVLGWLLAGRVMRPVHRITTTARRLEAEQLDRRINLDGPPDELKELADTFDGMLDRLAGSFDSQRRFVANASHELRTPLAVQRTLIEVAMADPTASPELLRLGTHLLHTNERSERLIEGLLVLARSDRGLRNREPVRLDRIVALVVASAADLAADAGVTLRSELMPRAVAGDASLLERLVTNVVHNAIHYNERGGTVVVRVAETPALVITNTGPRVPAESVSALFEPFRRLDRDRTAHRTGAGLGLSIVRSVARAHDGAADATPNPGGGLRIEVNLPVAALSVSEDTAGRRFELQSHGGD
jgi:signal transduction histidine kinase